MFDGKRFGNLDAAKRFAFAAPKGLDTSERWPIVQPQSGDGLIIKIYGDFSSLARDEVLNAERFVRPGTGPPGG